MSSLGYLSIKRGISHRVPKASQDQLHFLEVLVHTYLFSLKNRLSAQTDSMMLFHVHIIGYTFNNHREMLQKPPYLLTFLPLHTVLDLINTFKRTA